MLNPPTCPTCETIWQLVNTGERRLEEIAQVFDKPAPTISTHIASHGDTATDLMTIVTFGGQPLLRPSQTARPSDSQDVDAPAPAAAETAGATGEAASTQPEDLAASPIPAAWPEDTDPQELIDAGLITPEDMHRVHAVVPTAVDEFNEVLAHLINDHPHEPVRTHARLLSDALHQWEEQLQDRIRLEQLTVQRDQLQAEIDSIQSRLNPTASDLPQAPANPAPEPTDGSDGAGLVLPWEQIRDWGRQNGYPVKTTGKVAQSVVEAWRVATGGQVAS